jgi:putative aminopeptidase FrvX
MGSAIMNASRNSSTKKITIGKSQLALLERLSNAVAVSGDEGEVRSIILEQLKPVADELKVDSIGNVLAIRKSARKNALKVMIASHMDEVGFMLVQNDDENLYQFAVVGGIDVRQLPAKPVLIGKEHLPGVIGAKPIHLQEEDEGRRKIALDAMRIDFGLEKPSLKIGDRGSFATTFKQVGPSLVGKALDNRMGVALLIEILKNAPAHIELQAAFTVQEEVGLRGARVAAYAFNPDLAIALDSTPAFDFPAWDGEENVVFNTRLGMGPAIYLSDSGTLSDPRLVRYLVEVAEMYKIPFQFRQPGGGGTDAGAIHKQHAGIPSISISIPHRYTHSAVSIARFSDWQYTYALIMSALNDIQPSILKGDRK